MNTLILVGGLVVLGVVFINKAVPKIGEALEKTTGNLEYEKAKELGIAGVGEKTTEEYKYNDPKTGEEKTGTRDSIKGPGSQCVTDGNCQGDAFIGSKYRCIGGNCHPLVGMKNVFGSISQYSPIELGLNKVCNRYYLAGEGSPCVKNTSCSTSGVTCDPNDSSCIAEKDLGPEDVYCGNDKLCHKLSNPNVIGIKYRHDIDPQTYYRLGVTRKIDDNFREIDRLSYSNKCPELLQLKKGS